MFHNVIGVVILAHAVVSTSRLLQQIHPAVRTNNELKAIFLDRAFCISIILLFYGLLKIR
jgi:hypothetical protein